MPSAATAFRPFVGGGIVKLRLILVVILSLLPACGPSIFDLHQSDVGKLTQQEAEARFGSPDSRTRDDEGETWNYVVRYTLAQPPCTLPVLGRGVPACDPPPGFMTQFGTRFILRFGRDGLLGSYKIESGAGDQTP